MPFLPPEFTVPAVVETERFRMRSITIHDAFKDYDAVMSSRDHLSNRFGAVWGWPEADLSIEHNIVDLAWHQKEFQLRSSFDYAVMSLDESRLLGCVYIDPPQGSGTDADVWFWARQSELATGLEEELGRFVASWLASAWPFKTVTLNGRPRVLNPSADGRPCARSAPGSGVGPRTSHPDLVFSTTDAPPKDGLRVVDAGLDAHNYAAAPLADVAPMAAFAADPSGKVIGGAVGRTWGRCCELLQLWVTPEFRASGVGSRLLHEFEARARGRGCNVFYLTTLSFQAPDFYRKRGYEELARIDGYPNGVVKYLMSKTEA
jgi:GNAT superfamily N-acetyltransferase